MNIVSHVDSFLLGERQAAKRLVLLSAFFVSLLVTGLTIPDWDDEAFVIATLAVTSLLVVPLTVITGSWSRRLNARSPTAAKRSAVDRGRRVHLYFGGTDERLAAQLRAVLEPTYSVRLVEAKRLVRAVQELERTDVGIVLFSKQLAEAGHMNKTTLRRIRTLVRRDGASLLWINTEGGSHGDRYGHLFKAEVFVLNSRFDDIRNLGKRDRSLLFEQVRDRIDAFESAEPA